MAFTCTLNRSVNSDVTWQQMALFGLREVTILLLYERWRYVCPESMKFLKTYGVFESIEIFLRK